MGSSPPPPPPPPPQRQPYRWEKESSMGNRNEAFAYAIEASRNSYTAALIVKTLADRLLPITEAQLKAEIDQHYVVVTEYQKSRIIYNSTVNTFLHVDSIIASSLDKLDAIKDIGEVNIDALDTLFQGLLQKYNSMLSHEASVEQIYKNATAKLNEIKGILESAYSSTSPSAYAQADAIIAKKEIDAFSTQAQAKVVEARRTKTEADTLMNAGDPSIPAQQSRDSALSMVDKVIQTLQGVTESIVRTYNTDVTKLNKELERLKRWQAVYKSRADSVRNRDNIVLNGDVFIRLLFWARNAHINAIYSAMYAFTANRYAYQDVHYP
jgi:hypothetical protein